MIEKKESLTGRRWSRWHLDAPVPLTPRLAMKFLILKLEDVKGETWQTHHGPLGAPMSLLGERHNGLLTTLAGHMEGPSAPIL